MCKCNNRFLPVFFIIIALLLAISISVWHEQGLAYIVFVSRFFDVMLPVLAVGALIKYLLGCHSYDKCVSNEPEKIKEGNH